MGPTEGGLSIVEQAAKINLVSLNYFAQVFDYRAGKIWVIEQGFFILQHTINARSHRSSYSSQNWLTGSEILLLTKVSTDPHKSQAQLESLCFYF